MSDTINLNKTVNFHGLLGKCFSYIRLKNTDSYLVQLNGNPIQML